MPSDISLGRTCMFFNVKVCKCICSYGWTVWKKIIVLLCFLVKLIFVRLTFKYVLSSRTVVNIKTYFLWSPRWTGDRVPLITSRSRTGPGHRSRQPIKNQSHLWRVEGWPESVFDMCASVEVWPRHGGQKGR